MSIFNSILQKIFHSSASSQPAVNTPVAPTTAQAAAAPQATKAVASPPAANIDVGAVLSEMASMKGGGGNYQSSIVDLLKLLGLDPSLSARKELATELDVHAGDAGSAEQNIALHQAVMNKLAENGGIVPDNLRN